MKSKTFFIIFKGLLLKYTEQFFLEGGSSALSVKFVNLLKSRVIFDIFYYFCMFVEKHLKYVETCRNIKHLEM